MAYLELDVLNNTPFQLALGIDLGTTNSLGALWREGRPIVLHPEGGTGNVPSVIYFPEQGPPLVGREARDRAVLDPAHALFSIKRFMGRGLKDVQADLTSVPCPVTENENGVIQFELRGQTYTPQQLSALILMQVHDQACRAMAGMEITRAVITVPAYFDEPQRAATRDAARIAGIDVLRIVNEPTAASLAYGLDQERQGHVAVYDLGGGTFDVSILSIEDGVFRVLATAGDTHLGGDDLDRALVAAAREELSNDVSDETLGDPAFGQLLRLAAEKCKIELSQHPSAEMHVSLPESGVQWRRRFSREELEALIAPLVERTIDSCRRALADSGISAEAIDEVVLVGGSTRVPAVRARVREFFGRDPHTELNPDDIVALGAAVQAHVLVGGTRDILLMDVTPLSLGLETVGGAVSKVIERNSTIPCQATDTYTTYADGQTGIDFNVLQGERELAADVRSLGRFKLGGIPPMPAGMARVAVRFHIDADGLLTVSAAEQSTGTSSTIEIQPMNGLTDEEVESMLDEAYEHAREDFEARRVADLTTELGTMLRACEKGLANVGAELDPESRREVEETMAAARAARELKDARADDVQEARDALERAALPLAALLMDGVAKAALSGKSLDEV